MEKMKAGEKIKEKLRNAFPHYKNLPVQIRGLRYPIL
jgi:hypothetical protein